MAGKMEFGTPSHKKETVECELIDKHYSDDNRLIIEGWKRDSGKLSGRWNNVTGRVYLCDQIFINMTFENCEFNSNSFIDSCIFNKCKFVNCKINGDFRWVDFNKCEFTDTEITLNYFRASKITKDSKANNLLVFTKQVDEYVWLFGRRYGCEPWGWDKPIKF